MLFSGTGSSGEPAVVVTIAASGIEIRPRLAGAVSVYVQNALAPGFNAKLVGATCVGESAEGTVSLAEMTYPLAGLYVIGSTAARMEPHDTFVAPTVLVFFTGKRTVTVVFCFADVSLMCL